MGNLFIIIGNVYKFVSIVLSLTFFLYASQPLVFNDEYATKFLGITYLKYKYPIIVNFIYITKYTIYEFFNATQRNLHIIMKMRCACNYQALWSSQDTKCIHLNFKHL